MGRKIRGKKNFASDVFGFFVLFVSFVVKARGRDSRSFDMHRMINAESACGRPVFCTCGGIGAWVLCLYKIENAVSASNGVRPVAM